MVKRSDESQSAIEAHGIIGDMRTAALVNDQGSVDFLCWPESVNFLLAAGLTPSRYFPVGTAIAGCSPRTDVFA